MQNNHFRLEAFPVSFENQHLNARWVSEERTAAITQPDHHRRSIAPAGIMPGIGLGGFFDGIVLHQIMQVYAMLSAKLPLKHDGQHENQLRPT